MLAIDAGRTHSQHTDLVDRPCLPPLFAFAGGCLWASAKTIAAKLTQRQLWIGGGGCWLTGDKNTIKRLNQAVLNRRTSWPNTMRSIGFDRFLRRSIAAKKSQGARAARRLDRRTEGSYMRPWFTLEWLISSNISPRFFLSAASKEKIPFSTRRHHLQHATSGGMPKINVAFTLSYQFITLLQNFSWPSCLLYQQ
jgi:hypothetical protein